VSPRRTHPVRIVAGACVALALAAVPAALAAQQQPRRAPDWRDDWATEDGFALSLDTQGYRFPTAIAFVPHPGPLPGDPLYYVTELRGRVLVVTNDRTVHTFAEKFVDLTPGTTLPEEQGETGLAGICLDPAHGYVFVTLAYQDATGTLRNDLVRFTTTPRTFALKPSGQVAYTRLFSTARAAASHQIGGCRIGGGLLYVGVGDGLQSYESHNMASVLGKVLRMTVDGRPAPGNPFLVDADTTDPRNYIWAYGFRNPFGLTMLGDRVFVAENGPSVDRFVEVNRGADYLWDGSDWSMGTDALAVMTPSPAPVQIDHYPEASTLFPAKWRGSFFVATSGLPARKGSGERRGAKGVLSIDYDPAGHRLAGVPHTFVAYRGDSYQSVVGLAFGPDGLYFVPLFPQSDGHTAVLKVRYDPAHPHAHLVSDVGDPLALIGAMGCYGCHALGDRRYGAVGPALDRDSLVARLEVRLRAPAYRAASAALDARDDEPFRSYRDARHEVLAATGDAQLERWVTYHLREPRFDNPGALMPNLGLSAGEAEVLARFLLRRPESRRPGGWAGVKATIEGLLPRPGYKSMALAFLVGVMIPLAWLGARRAFR
jgi:glucose/arabinose dehydrogenase